MAGSPVLKALDGARTQAYHFLAIVIAGMGFFTDAYDLFCISSVTKLLGRIYYYDPTSKKPGVLPIGVSSAVTGVALVGTLCGQLFFGWLGDKLGRKTVYGFTLLMMIGCAIAQGLSFGHTATSVMVTLCFFRFWLGFGIGGDYPLSATIMAEYSNTRTRGAFIGAVFAMQGIGILFAAAVALLVAGCFNDSTHAPSYAEDPVGSTPLEADWVWRIILMAGAVPAALTFYWRLKMPETARFTALVQKDAAQAAQDMGTVLKAEFAEQDAVSPASTEYGLFSAEFRSRHMVHLIGCAGSWFFLDIAFYSQNLFQKDIFTAVGWLPKAATMSAITEVYKVARAQALIALCGTVPGYWVTVLTVDWLGRKLIQLQGFVFMTIFMAVLSGEYPYFKNHSHAGFVIIYGCTFFFANFGPNATTFILPAELFPARLRSTCHGIAAACGKAGAIVGAFGFLYAAQPTDPTKTDAGYPTGIGIRWALGILAISNFLGLLSTFLVIETKQRSLEEISDEYGAGTYTIDHDGKSEV